MLTARTCTAEDVAGALGLTVASLKRKYRKLHETKAFPLPLPGAEWRWSTRALEDWIDAAGKPRAAGDDQGPTTDRTNIVDLADDVVHRQNLALRERYGSRS